MSDKKHKENPEQNGSSDKSDKRGKAKGILWPLYLALFTGAFLLLGDVLQVFYMWQSKARIGTALLMTALTMILASNARMRTYCGIIIWGALALTFWL
ncbi:hypothetical protein JYT16_02140 [Gemmatimonas aurantiaca]|nr:hypothetical protein [Gemmatimonas aurantiaca]